MGRLGWGMVLVLGCTAPPPLPGENPPPTCDELAEAIPSEGWAHVTDGTDVTYMHNPPASGPHYPEWLAYQEYERPARRANWVHNLEHGGIVLLYRPDAPPDAVATMKSAFSDAPVDVACGHPRTLLTPDPLLSDNVAAVAATRVMAGGSLTKERVLDFIRACRGNGPEDVCTDGTAAAP